MTDDSDEIAITPFTKAYLGPCQITTMVFFLAKIVLAVKYFRKNFHHRYLTGS